MKTKRVMICLHTTMTTGKSLKLHLQTCSNDISDNIFPIKHRSITAYQHLPKLSQLNQMSEIFQNIFSQALLTTLSRWMHKINWTHPLKKYRKVFLTNGSASKTVCFCWSLGIINSAAYVGVSELITHKLKTYIRA